MKKKFWVEISTTVEYSDENVFFFKKVDFWVPSSKSEGSFISIDMVEIEVETVQIRSKSNFVRSRIFISGLEIFFSKIEKVIFSLISAYF